jgi:NAD(P)-dependent dehydrogenase (short-subunit alcohol dehydrogenase family)
VSGAAGESLADRVVLVTGAAGGIGSATSRTIVAAGGRVVLHDRDPDRVAPVAQQLGPNAIALASDLRDAESVGRVWDDAVAVNGRIDVLVNNAGVFARAGLELDLDAWLRVWHDALAVNLVAPAILCRAAVRSFSAQPSGGIIVNVASVAGHRGALEEYWHYGAAKAGLLALTRTIARHYGDRGVTAFAIAPGYVETKMSRGTRSASAAQGHGGLSEPTQPQDVANVIAWLATGQGRHATGTTIDVNGASYVR